MGVQHQLSGVLLACCLYCDLRDCLSESEDLSLSAWTQSRELKDSLVDMYKANPKVNEELKQRLPSPVKQLSSEPTLERGDLGASSLVAPESADRDWPQVPPHLLTTQEKGSRSPSPHSPRTPVPVTGRGRSPSPPRAPGLECRAMEVDRPSSRSSLPRADSFSDGGLGGGGSRGPGSPVHRRQLAHIETNSPVLDKEKNISFLLKELDSLRDLNKRLQDKLVQQEKEVESRLVDAELLETELEARVSVKAGALVEEIYQAQRDRDQAVMARLRLANEERDEALLRAKRLQQAAAKLEDINLEDSDADLEELLNRVNSADSALAIERSGSVIVDRVQKAQERRRQITAEEMNAVIHERDNAIAKCKRLEQDLLQERDQSQTSANNACHLTAAENNQERVRKEELDRLQRERDELLEHSQQLEEEMQRMRTHQSFLFPLSSLHQSQFDPSTEQKPQTTPALSSQSQALQTTLASQPMLPRDSPTPLGSMGQQQPLVVQLHQLAKEHQNTQTKLQLSQAAEKEANERVQKLERLVEVLRKKVGTGNVRTVI
ncbi:mirror-image polydactyly gene 1 protein [Aplochiton taeniatus]